MRVSRIVLVLLPLWLWPVGAVAHHGRDYLNVRSADLPHPGQVYFVPRCDFATEGGVSETELEPSLLVGALPWLSAEVHAHISGEEGEDLRYEATAPSVQISLPGERTWGVSLSTEYELAAESDGHDRAEAIGIVSGMLSGYQIAINLRWTGEDHVSPEWGYAAGLRSRAAPGLSFGLEAQGGFAGDAQHEALLGMYIDAASRTTLNLGLGAGLGPQGPDATLRTTVVFRIK